MKKLIFVFLCLLIISPCAFMLSACSEPIIYSVFVKTSDASAGMVSGHGEFIEGTLVTIKATPDPDKEIPFLCWTLNNKIVSEKQEYSFNISNETKGTYVAVFDYNLDYYALTEVALTLNDGTQAQELSLNLQGGPSLASLQTLYESNLKTIVLTQNAGTVDNFYNGCLIHKRTIDDNYYCKITAKTKYEETTNDYNANFDLNFNTLFDNGFYKTQDIALGNYGSVKFTFEKLNKTIVYKTLKLEINF